MSDEKQTKNFQVKELEGSQIEITAEIPAEIFEKHRARAVKELSRAVEIPGFRKGSAPESVLVNKVGEGAILQEMAEHAISEFYLNVLKEENIDAIGRPAITITKIARGNPLGVKIVTAVFPKSELPDYKKIAERINSKKREISEVADKDVEDTVLEIRKNWHRATKSAEASKKGEGKTEEEGLPELTDDSVRQFGDFKTVLDFKVKIRENLQEERKTKDHEKKRIEIIEEILAGTKVQLPEVLVENEKGKIIAQLKANISGMGLKAEDYFKHIQKTEEDMKKELQGDAEKRVKMQIVLNKIAEAERVEVPPDEVELEAKRVLEYHKGADPDRARDYVEGLLSNERVFKFLEEYSGKKEVTK
ncbi:MAG TPA: trigger factor [Candidatus Paceibacterota bacterium]